MNLSAQDAIALIWKLAIALVAVVPILSVIGVWLLARFSNVFDAYAGERAKLQVQFDNVAKLVEQTKALTATTETIKANLSDEMWDRQMRWSYKRDLYIKIIGSITDLINAQALTIMYQQANRDIQGQLTAFENSLMQYYTLRELAPLVIPKSAMLALLEVVSDDGGRIFTPDSLTGLRSRLNLFRIEARKDLGYSENKG